MRRVALLVLMLSAVGRTTAAQTSTDALTASTLRSYSTIYSIGFEWDITGDADHDASGTVEYRVRGAADWLPALPLVRVDYNGRNMLAGGLFTVAPATAYDVRLTLGDPDGGTASQEIAIATRRLPTAPAGGRVLHIAPGTGGGDGSLGFPFRGIAAAQAVAQPGDTFLLHAGDYGGRVRFDVPGTADSYIAWRAAGDGEVLLQGIDVAASHLWLEGLVVRDLGTALMSFDSPTNVVVTRCGFFNNGNAIYLQGAGTNWYIADNAIVGNTPAASGSLAGEGIDLNVTSGHTVAHNSITNVADGISYPHTNVDIFGNDIFDTADDGIELDNGRANVRVWQNRIHNAVHNGISFQPQSGAPWYIVRNQIVGSIEAAFKFRTTDRLVLLHNTIVHWGDAWPGSSMMCCNEWDLLKAFGRNNLWVSIQGGQIWGFETATRDWRSDLDYDAFDWGSSTEPFTYGGATYPDVWSFSRASGLETNARQISHATCFSDFRVPGPSPMHVPPHVMTLDGACEAVDSGQFLPNVNDGFFGSAPDRGAHEYGHPPAIYGPRARARARPAAPTGLTAVASGAHIDLQWAPASSDESGFWIERSSEGASFLRIALVGPGTAVYTDTNVVRGTPYTYRIAAYNEAGSSAYSNTASATVPISRDPIDEIVLYAAEATTLAGWQRVTDASAAGGARLQNPNAGAAKRSAPVAAPSSYFELTFTADAGRPYRLWMRGKADGNSWANDSVFVQFDGSVTEAGAPVYRIGTTSATNYNLEDCSGCGLSGWGWQDNGWGVNVLGPEIYFATSGPQRMRVQVREDGLGIDQVVLSAATYLTSSPGALKNDGTILPRSTSPEPTPDPAADEIVLYAAEATTLAGWQRVTDASAAGGARLQNPNAGAAKRSAPVAAPSSYFELTFTADAGRPYRLWMRGKADGNSWANDSVFVQFDGSVTEAGAPVYRIGTTSATNYNLEDCSGCGLSGWGWQDNGWGVNVLGPEIYFATSGPQRMRVQVREDGLGIDQVVLSAATYLISSPGALKNDGTILPPRP